MPRSSLAGVCLPKYNFRVAHDSTGTHKRKLAKPDEQVRTSQYLKCCRRRIDRSTQQATSRTLMDSGWIPIVAVLVGVHWLLASSNLHKAKRLSGGTLFTGSLMIRLLFISNCIIGICGAVSSFYVQYLHQNWIATIVFSLLVAGSIRFWPEAILISDAAISQSVLLGLGRKAFQWRDVDYAREDPGEGCVEVVSKDGAKITYSKLHVGRRQFLDEIEKRCRML